MKQSPTLLVRHPDPALILYEYPFNESIRTQLRLERLFARFDQLVRREHAVDHHFALATLFEIVDVAGQLDVRADLLKGLQRHHALFLSYQGNPQVAQTTLEQVLARLSGVLQNLEKTPGKMGAMLMSHEGLMEIRQQLLIPGGSCEFDLPAYHAWQHGPVDRRQHDLLTWAESLQPLADALNVALGLLRDTGTWRPAHSQGGQYQQNLPAGRPHQLLRLRLDSRQEVVPELKGHPLMVSVRMMRVDTDGRLRPYTGDASFDVALCA